MNCFGFRVYANTASEHSSTARTVTDMKLRASVNEPVHTATSSVCLQKTVLNMQRLALAENLGVIFVVRKTVRIQLTRTINVTVVSALLHQMLARHLKNVDA